MGHEVCSHRSVKRRGAHLNRDRYVVDIMTPNPVIIGTDALAWTADCLAEQRDVHHLIVMEHYELVGEVCRCDLRSVKGGMRVGDCMRSPPITVEDQETTRDAVGRMAQCGVGCLPVVDWMGALHGVVTRRDLRRVGALPERQSRACAACGSSHGIGPAGGDEEIVFCSRCTELMHPPRTTVDHIYWALGGSD